MSHLEKIYIFCLCSSIPIGILVLYQNLNSVIPIVFKYVESFLTTKPVAELLIFISGLLGSIKYESTY